MSSAHTGRTFVKFDFGDNKKSAEKIKIWVKSDKDMRHFT